MYVAPETYIKILKDVPLDTTYDHTLWFPKTDAGKTAQQSYFASKAKYSLSNQSYQRVQRGWIRINIRAENLYDCNYLMFQNHAFGTKWFYAFIKSVEYVNDSVAQIEFSIDVMQTWYFDYELEECFVEREHQQADVIGDNLIPENFELGEYISDNPEPTGLMDGYKLVIAATFSYDDSGSTPVYYVAGGGKYGGIFSGLEYNVFDLTTEGIQRAIDCIENAMTYADGIVSIYYAPTSFVTSKGQNRQRYNISKTKSLTDIDGYTPKNKKLFTYPYNFLYVTNLQGDSEAFPYEYFTTNTCDFQIDGTFQSNPTIMATPKNYKGVTTNYDESLIVQGFPQCAYNTDVFKAWLAQAAIQYPFQMLSGVMSGGSSIMQSNYMANAMGTESAAASAELAPILAGVGIAKQLTQILGQVATHRIQPHRAHGYQSGNVLAANNLIDFYFCHKHIRAEFARIIDDYFSCYGYACHRVKVPNIKARPHWTYTKTVGCTIVGSIPCDDAKSICGIFDNGITFWVNPSEVGNYSLDNSPTLGPNP